MTAAAFEVYKAVDENILAGLVAAGVRYYAGEAPHGTPLPYVVGEGHQERRGNTFNAAGYVDVRTFHIYAQNEGRVLEIYSLYLEPLLKLPLSMASFAFRWSNVDLSGTFNDRPGLEHGVVRWECGVKVSP